MPEGNSGGAEGRRAAAALLKLQRSIGRRSRGAKLSDADVRSAIEVPGIWPLEVANALLVLRRRGVLTEREQRLAAERLRMLPHVVDADTSFLAFGVLSQFGAKYGLSVYDAAYLQLAKRRGLPLASKDGPLIAAARKARVAIWTAA